MENKIDWNRLNCMNYQVNCEVTGDYWYAYGGVRSLYKYAKLSGTSFRHMINTMIEVGQITIMDLREPTDDCPIRGELTLTMI